MKPPISRRYLDIAIERLAGRFGEAQRIRRSVANTIVAQLMPSGVIKGGSSLKFQGTWPAGTATRSAHEDPSSDRAEASRRHRSFAEQAARPCRSPVDMFAGGIGLAACQPDLRKAVCPPSPPELACPSGQGRGLGCRLRRGEVQPCGSSDLRRGHNLG